MVLILFEVIFIFIFVIINLILFYIGITKNKELSEVNKKLINSCNSLKEQVRDLGIEKRITEKDIESLKKTQDTIKESISSQEELSEKAFSSYYDMLEKRYDEAELEHETEMNALQNAYSDLQLKLMREADECRQDLDKLRSTRAAAIEAQRREKELESNISFYCLSISDADKSDIAKLESLKPSLNKPRVLSMLIWQTWFQKPLKSLSAEVVGANDKMGIYKITNIKTKECYIGQAVSIKDRWVDHVKCGLGIDTPAGNKLYKSMQEYGVWNFSFEVLEECPRDQLNEKEKYYIDLYSSYDYGFNSNRGNR